MVISYIYEKDELSLVFSKYEKFFTMKLIKNILRKNLINQARIVFDEQKQHLLIQIPTSESTARTIAIKAKITHYISPTLALSITNNYIEV